MIVETREDYLTWDDMKTCYFAKGIRLFTLNETPHVKNLTKDLHEARDEQGNRYYESDVVYPYAAMWSGERFVLFFLYEDVELVDWDIDDELYTDVLEHFPAIQLVMS